MNHRVIIISLLFTGLFLIPAALAGESKVPHDGTVYVGEADLDLSDCDIRNGDEIAWWESGNPQGTPTARARVTDVMRFTIDPETFRGHTGTWYGLIGKKVAFKVEDPFLQADFVENGIDIEPDSIKRGNLVSFKISTNLAGLSQRPGSSGAIVTLNLTGPNETIYHTLTSTRTNDFNLDKVYVYTSPYDTGAVWDTSDVKKFPDGEYSLSAITNVNRINEINPEIGATCTEKKTFTLGKTEVKKTEKDTDKLEKTSDKKKSDLSEESTGNVTPTVTQKEQSGKKVKKTGNITEDSTPEVTEEPTQIEKTGKKVKATPTPTGTVTEEITTVPPTLETEEPSLEPTEEPTEMITPRPTRTPFPRPPGVGTSPVASPTKASPLPPIIILTALGIGAALAAAWRRE
jgi:hypothetical protein